MRITVSVVESFLGGLLVMLGMKYLHHDVPQVPPLGYWASFFPTSAVLCIGRMFRKLEDK